jgi:3'-phosphoadenosine 5'-phosphosulfate sulfotransferase (PAPS reductase)/FAD synthetase
MRQWLTDSPYFIEGPALISFSGGRTSAYMLHEILRAYDGQLPEDVVVAFANTGKEREETLRFVHECGSRWGVHVHWVEWRPGGFEEVGINSAARAGEPFQALISRKHTIPNGRMSFCSEVLKVHVMKAFCRSLGWHSCANPIGLRRDEERRVFKQRAYNVTDTFWRVACPLYDAGVTKSDVMEFWSLQDFDLQLQPWEGNCDLCFKKGERIIERLIRDNPDSATWWIAQEERIGHQFKLGRRSYREMSDHVRAAPLLPILDPDEEYDVECGLLCGDVA